MVRILFENDDIIAVDKPAGLACIAERNKEKDNMHAQLLAIYPHKIYIVHRLDKEASGVVLFAKNADAHRHLCRQFMAQPLTEHAVKKTYLALLHGDVTGDTGTIDKPIRQFGSGRVAADVLYGKPCITEYEVVERFRQTNGGQVNNYTLLRCYPVTGRRHQLRVHFYSIGHAIVGDPLYGTQPHVKRGAKYLARGFTTGSRLMLHAERITFTLPTDKELTIKSPPPESFRQVIESLQKAYS